MKRFDSLLDRRLSLGRDFKIGVSTPEEILEVRFFRFRKIQFHLLSRDGILDLSLRTVENSAASIPVK